MGGGNSAGQAAVKLADHAREVHVVARRPLELGMSRYLLDQIEAKSNVRVWSGCEARALEGDEKLEAVVISGCRARSPRRDLGGVRDDRRLSQVGGAGG